MVFARAKGRAENMLNQTRFPRKHIFRPGYIHPSGNRKPPGLSYKLLLPVIGLLFKLFPGIGISSSDLARAMVDVGLNSQSKSRVFEASEIKLLLSTNAVPPMTGG